MSKQTNLRTVKIAAHYCLHHFKNLELKKCTQTILIQRSYKGMLPTLKCRVTKPQNPALLY